MRNRFTERQIIVILKEHEAGASVADLCRMHGVNDVSIDRDSGADAGPDDAERPVVARLYVAPAQRGPLLSHSYRGR